LGVYAGGNDAIVAREPELSSLGDLARGRQQGIDPRKQPRPLRLPGRVAEPVGREEGRDAERVRVTECEIRKARQGRAGPARGVESPALERERKVRPHAYRHAEAASARDRKRKAR